MSRGGEVEVAPPGIVDTAIHARPGSVGVGLASPSTLHARLGSVGVGLASPSTQKARQGAAGTPGGGSNRPGGAGEVAPVDGGLAFPTRLAQLLTTYYSLLTAYCLLPTTYYSLLTTHY